MSMTIGPEANTGRSSQAPSSPQVVQTQLGAISRIKEEDTSRELSVIRKRFKEARTMAEKTAYLQALIEKMPVLRGKAIKEQALRPEGGESKEESSLDHVIREIQNEVSEAVLKQSLVHQRVKDEPQRAEFLSIARHWLATAQPERRFHHLWELVTYYHSTNNIPEAMKILEEISPSFPPEVKERFTLLKENPTLEAIFAFQTTNLEAIEKGLEKSAQAPIKNVSDLLRHTPIMETLVQHLTPKEILSLREMSTDFRDVLSSFITPKMAAGIARRAFSENDFSLNALSSPAFRDNRLIVLAALSRNWREYMFISSNLQKDLAINVLAWALAKTESPESEKAFLAAMPKEVRESKEFQDIVNPASTEPLLLSDEENLNPEDIQAIQDLRDSDEELKKILKDVWETTGDIIDETQAEEVYSDQGSAENILLLRLARLFETDHDIAKINVMKGNPVPDHMVLADREIALEIARTGSFRVIDLLSYMPQYHNDKEIAALAVQKDPFLFRFVNKELQRTPEVQQAFRRGMTAVKANLLERRKLQREVPQSISTSTYQKIVGFIGRFYPW